MDDDGGVIEISWDEYLRDHIGWLRYAGPEKLLRVVRDGAVVISAGGWKRSDIAKIVEERAWRNGRAEGLREAFSISLRHARVHLDNCRNIHFAQGEMIAERIATDITAEAKRWVGDAGLVEADADGS